MTLRRTRCLTFGLIAAASLTAFAQDRRQSEESATIEVRQEVTLKYLLFLPDGYDKDPKQRWPLVLFLHGAGERGNDLNRVKIHGPPKLVEQKPGDYPFILVSPQCPSNQFWNAAALNGLLDKIEAEHRVDKDRVYVTGLSMGGFGTWSLAALRPERFAAIAPICGGGDVATAPKIKGIPTWVFHGAKDTAVPLARSQEMVDALKAAGGDPKFTIYPEAGHDSWTETYANPEFYKWLLAQKRAAP